MTVFKLFEHSVWPKQYRCLKYSGQLVAYLICVDGRGGWLGIR